MMIHKRYSFSAPRPKAYNTILEILHASDIYWARLKWATLNLKTKSNHPYWSKKNIYNFFVLILKNKRENDYFGNVRVQMQKATQKRKHFCLFSSFSGWESLTDKLYLLL